jgi:ADP-ribosylglycohydrolase
MSEQPDSKDAGDNTLDEAQVESVSGGACDADTIVAITGALKQAYENLVDFTSHVIERVSIK